MKKTIDSIITALGVYAAELYVRDYPGDGYDENWAATAFQHDSRVTWPENSFTAYREAFKAEVERLNSRGPCRHCSGVFLDCRCDRKYPALPQCAECNNDADCCFCEGK